MHRLTSSAAAVVLAMLAACGQESAPAATRDALVSTSASISGDACWGQATRAFAQLGDPGDFGEHASSQATPREGLANVARELYEQGIIPEPTLQALGAFLSSQLGLSIDACLQ